MIDETKGEHPSPQPDETPENQAPPADQAGEADDEAQSRIQELEERLKQAEAQIEESKNEVLRAMAETQTVRRRLREQHEEQLKYAAEGLVRELLPVLDNMERTLHAAQKGNSMESLVKGVQAVDKQLRKALGKHGVQRLESIGKEFDPEIHEALETHPSEEHGENVVTTEIEPGYRLNDRVIRPARVRVSSGGA